MKTSVLDGKRILVVDDEPDIIALLNEEITDACPNCSIDEAGTYEDALKKLESNHYDLVVLDIMGVRGFDLLGVATEKGMKVAMLTAHALSPDALKRSRDMGARAYLPKETLGKIVPFLEDVLNYEFEPGWKRLLEKLHRFFTEKFEPDWEKKTGEEWKEWQKRP